MKRQDRLARPEERLSSKLVVLEKENMGTNERKRAHKRREYIILGLFFVLVIGAAVFLQNLMLARSRLTAHFVAPTGAVSEQITLRIASTPAERAKGLMYENNLAEMEGMVFIFPDEEPRSFWMKNTPLSLDMIFIRKDLRVNGVVESTTPFSTQSYSVAGSSQYVVELNAGIARKLGVVKDSVIVFEGPIPRGVTDTAGSQEQ